MTVYLKDNIQETNTHLTKTLDKLVTLANENGEIIMTKVNMAKELGCSPRTVSRWVTQAEEKGYLKTVSRSGRLGRTAVQFTDKAVTGAVVTNAVSNSTPEINERLAQSIERDVHVRTVIPERRRGKYSPRRSKVELERERNAKMIKQTRNAKLNREVAKLYKKFCDSMSYKFFEDNFEDPEERKHEYLVWLLSKLYDAYFKENTRNLNNLGCNVSITDGYESLDVEKGYFGTRNHTTFSTVLKSYLDNDQGKLMTMFIANTYSRRYHGIESFLKSGGSITGVNPNSARPFPNNLTLENTLDDFTKSYDTVLNSIKRKTEEEGKVFQESDKLFDTIVGIIGTDVMDSVPCMLVVNEINSVLGLDETINKRLRDSSNEYGQNLKREDTKTIVETFQYLSVNAPNMALQIDMTEAQLKDYVMYSRYYDNVMSYAENLQMSRNELNLTERILTDYINYKRFGLDTPVEAFESNLSMLITIGMSDATYDIMRDDTINNKHEALIELYSSMLPNDYLARYRAGDTNSLMYTKFLRAINMLFKFYYEGYNYNQGLAHVLIKSKNERLHRSDSVEGIQEVAHKLQDVLMLNELGLPDWEQVNQRLVVEGDKVFVGHHDDVTYYDHLFGAMIDRNV